MMSSKRSTKSTVSNATNAYATATASGSMKFIRK